LTLVLNWPYDLLVREGVALEDAGRKWVGTAKVELTVVHVEVFFFNV
jgi:hypothetical protein